MTKKATDESSMSGKLCTLKSSNRIKVHTMKKLSDGSLEFIPNLKAQYILESQVCLVLEELSTSALHFYIENIAYFERWSNVVHAGGIGWVLSENLRVL